MSSRLRSRALEKGRVKALRRLKQPMTVLLALQADDDAQAPRAAGSRRPQGAGRHIPSRGAQRRADRMALQALLRRETRHD